MVALREPRSEALCVTDPVVECDSKGVPLTVALEDALPADDRDARGELDASVERLGEPLSAEDAELEGVALALPVDDDDDERDAGIVTVTVDKGDGELVTDPLLLIDA